MSPTPCTKNADLNEVIEKYANDLKEQAHTIGTHGMSEQDFYQSGIFRGAIEKIRGTFSATMAEKWNFAGAILNYMQDEGHIAEWESTGGQNRHDYVVTLNDQRLAAIELKGCLDGNNTNIFERPPHVQEFIVWSICSNEASDPRHNAWSGIHTRLSAEIISKSQQVDGLILSDWLCGTICRPCPKLLGDGPDTPTEVGRYRIPPPCIYIFPSTIPSPRNNPSPVVPNISEVGILKAFHDAFGGSDRHVNTVNFEVSHQGPETVRSTVIRRDGQVVRQSARPTPIRRT